METTPSLNLPVPPSGRAGMEHARRVADRLMDAKQRRLEAELDEANLLAEMVQCYELPNWNDADLPTVVHEHDLPIGGEGAPLVPEFLVLELCGILQLNGRQVTMLLGDVLNLKYRQPTLWDAVQAYELPMDRAYRAARRSVDYLQDMAEAVTTRWLPRQARKGWTSAFNLLKAECPSVAAQKEREQLERRRFSTEPFPHSSTPSRGLQLDHTINYQHGGPPGQTGKGNLAPLTTRVHRGKTAGHLHVTQLEPGALIWTSPLGYRYQVKDGDTTRLE